jgi:hypothetical protein
LAERINTFNLRKKYFDGVNKISVTFDVDSNIGKKHYDNTTTVLVTQKWESGTLMTFVNPTTSQDKNYLYSANTVDFGVVTGISGTTLFPNFTGDTAYPPMVIQYATGQTGNATVVYNLSKGSNEINYKYPSDIEYFQVLTAITISDAIKLKPTGSSGGDRVGSSSASLRSIILGYTKIYWNNTESASISGWRLDTKSTDDLYYEDMFQDYDNQYITILQRGVDPYSPMYTNEYGIGRLLGFPKETDIKFKTSARLNIPIQKLTNRSGYSINVSVQDFREQNSTFYSSYFFGPGNQWSGFTTTNLGYYGALDAQYRDSLKYSSNNVFSGLYGNTSASTINGVDCVISMNTNATYSNTTGPIYGPVGTPRAPLNAYYDESEDLSGGGFYFTQVGRSFFGANRPDTVGSVYYSPCLYDYARNNPMSIGNKGLNILRTDRLPSSDFVNTGSTYGFSTLLQQNLGFTVYLINETQGEDFVSEKFGLGADTFSPDIEGQVGSSNVLTTLNLCENIQSLDCYSGSGTSFGVIPGCSGTDTIEGGCYVLMDKPLIDLQKDLKSFAEWGFRFKFFYGLCRGVLSQTFVNNWVNGTLYAPPIQVITYFNKENKPESPIYCKDVVYFESDTNNFYYRSSPYKQSTGKFIGKSTATYIEPINKTMLQYPTTIMNLGFKDSFYDEIMFNPSANAYVMNSLSDTSYNDTSDLVNLFVISRITDETYLQQVFNGFNPSNSLDQLFTRDGEKSPKRRIDGDLAQLLSINSEEGVIPFSAQYYQSTGGTNEPVQILGSLSKPTMAVWFSSTTENLQLKDYLSPGRINFRNSTNTSNYPFTYGIKTQVVPFYQWKLGNNNSTIFGNDRNDWATESTDIVQNKGYQTQDRINPVSPTYFYSRNINLNTVSGETSARGYIFSLDASGNYSSQLDGSDSKFTVGAPFHFYFGLIKGESALDKFKTKYSVSE